MAVDSPTPPPQSGTQWTAGRILLVILGSIVALLAAGLLAAGGALLWADRTQRDDDGFLTTPTGLFESDSYAITSEGIDLFEADTGGDWVLTEGILGDVRLTVEATSDVFVGIGETADVDAYLDGVAHDQVRDLKFDPFRARYRRFSGGPPPGPPGDQTFWAASASGSGEQTATWEAEAGEWTIVLMNADASQGVSADLSAGAEANFLLWLALGLLLAGLLVLAAGVLLIVLGARRATSSTAAAAPASTAALASRRRCDGRGEADDRLPGRGARRARPRRRALALARQVAARDPALHRAPRPLVRPLGPDRGRVLRDPLHRPLPARDLRLQPGRAALDVARLLLLLLGARDRPLPAVLARRGARLPRHAPHRLPGAALALAPPRQVAARHPPPDPGRHLRGRLGLGLGSGRATTSGGSGLPASSASSS